MTVVDISTARNEAEIAEIANLRGEANAEFAAYEEMLALADDFRVKADVHYRRHTALALRADSISERRRRNQSDDVQSGNVWPEGAA